MTKDPFRLDGKTILVTGASSGIGRQICIEAARRGARIILTARDENRLRAVCAELEGAEHTVIPGDIWELTSSKTLVGALPELDGVVHSAGYTKIVPVAFLSEQLLRSMSQVLYEAPVLLSQQMLKARKVRKMGSVVFIASIAARIAMKGNATYSGLKASLCSFARCMALETAAQRIRVNTISPAQVRTAIMQPDGPISAEMFAQYEKRYPLGFGEPEDVAYAAVYLLSDAAKWITGTDIVLDGGFLLE